jgi:predicted acetyltransferase
MPTLIAPDARCHRSFLEAMAGFAAEGRGGADDHSMIGRDLREWAPAWEDREVFAAYARSVRAQELEATPRPATFVPCTTRWWCEGTTYLGRIQLRHRLNDWLLEVGGHIGYDVAPAHRRRGHASAMLRAFLPWVREAHGLEQVLVTCDVDNVPSRRVIESCSGVLEDQRGVKLRYWVPTG